MHLSVFFPGIMDVSTSQSSNILFVQFNTANTNKSLFYVPSQLSDALDDFPNQNNQAGGPVWPGQPANPTWPGQPTNPTWPSQPNMPVWPGQPNQPAQPGQPGQPGAPGWPGPAPQTGPYGVPEQPAKPLVRCSICIICY